jgi:uncharacterized protein GlcG (DUF336 family)
MNRLAALAGAGAIALLTTDLAQAQPAPPPYGPPITLEIAKKAVAAAETEAEKNNWAVVITVIDSGGHIVMTVRRDDAQLASIALAEGKARTALNFKRPTKLVDEAVAQGGAGLRLLGLRDVTPIEGGLPIVVDAKIIGAIGVSGMLATQDGQVARVGADAAK